LNRYCTGVLTASGTSSFHYRDGGGHAVDFDYVDGVRSTGWNPTDINYLKQIMTRLPGGSALGQADCRANHKVSFTTPSGVSQLADTCDHNHIQVPVR
jgi:hypothetical protein